MIAIYTAYTKYSISVHHFHGALHVNCVNDVMALAGPVTLNASVGERRAQQLRHRKVARVLINPAPELQRAGAGAGAITT